jgi:hypothetical protein
MIPTRRRRLRHRSSTRRVIGTVLCWILILKFTTTTQTHNDFTFFDREDSSLKLFRCVDRSSLPEQIDLSKNLTPTVSQGVVVLRVMGDTIARCTDVPEEFNRDDDDGM